MVVNDKKDEINSRMSKLKKLMKISGSQEQVLLAYEKIQELYQQKISIGRKEPKVVYKKNAPTVGDRMENLAINKNGKMSNNTVKIWE